VGRHRGVLRMGELRARCCLGREALAVLFWSFLACYTDTGAKQDIIPGTVAVLEGRVVCKEFWGPPNYGEDPERDARETACMVCPRPDRCYQLVVSSEKVWRALPGRALRALEGKLVKVRGEVFRATTGHHRTPLLIDVAAIEVRTE